MRCAKVPFMETYVAPMSKDGEVAIPETIRRRLRLDDGASIEFVVRDDGSVEVRRAILSLEDVFGSLPALPGRSDDFDVEIKAAMEVHFAEKYKHFK